MNPKPHDYVMREGGGEKENISTYRSNITKLIRLASKNLPQDAPHDLAGSRLREVDHDIHRLGRREGADAPTHLHDELLAQGVRDLRHIRDRDEGVDRLAREVVVHANYRRLGHVVMLDQGRLDLGRRQPMAADVDDVVDTSPDPVVALVVASCTIAGELFRYVLAMRHFVAFSFTPLAVILT